MAAPKSVIVLTDDLARRLGQQSARKLAAVLHSEQECIMPERRTTQDLDDHPTREREAPFDEIEVPPPGPGYYVTDGYPHRETDPKNWRRLDEDPVDAED